MKKKVMFMIVVWVTMTVVLYGTTFAEVSTDVKIACGIVFAILYASMILGPYFVAKRKGSKESLENYLWALLGNE